MPWLKATPDTDAPAFRHAWTTWALKGLGVRVSLAHGDPLDEAKNGVHLNRWTPSP